MEKSIFSEEYRLVTMLLKQQREALGITQVQLAEMLGRSQSFISKVERGERLLDIIQLRQICMTVGTTLPDFVRELERLISER